MGTEGALTHRVVRVCLDDAALTPDQRTLLDRHAGTARAVWNWGLAARNAQQDALMAHVRAVALEQAASDETAAAELLDDRDWRTATIKAAPDELRRPLRAATLGRAFTAETRDPDSRFAWWAVERHGVNRFAVSSSLQALDAAFDRYYRDTGGHRSARRARPRKDGRPAAWPRFKKRGRATDAFALFNLVVAGQDPWRVIEGAHRIKVPSLGSLRVHENTKRLRRLIARGGRPTSARFTRTGGRWYMSVVVALPATAASTVLSPAGAPRAAAPTRAQTRAGLVGVDLGIKTLATMSDGTLVANARHGRAAARRLARLQRRAARQQGPRKGAAPSKGWVATQRTITRLQHDTAARRRGLVYELTKTLAAGYAAVAIEDLNVAGMTATPAARPDPDRPGVYLANGRAAKSGLNRAILDVGFGEFRRQLTYKTPMYGAQLLEIARFAPTSKTCSTCGAVRAKLRLDERTYRCEHCGLVIDRDLNAARNIAALGHQALGTSPADAGDAKRRDHKEGDRERSVILVSQDLGPPRSAERVTDSSPPTRAA
ncbi:RNA-guided endonuclease InsQ/TnpB family protein [Cellulosimicrobium cellulans]|uniref:RNA-guided endonuclease InsQ/TnpB family protein n=1 Tax=Cellulosimicrobium cellulans TaxID=1710 RepID=UPI0006852E3C|nr:RNA-guided endonuclease TnpB family protein [Cellulosimicrobium cellulans]